MEKAQKINGGNFHFIMQPNMVIWICICKLILETTQNKDVSNLKDDLGNWPLDWKTIMKAEICSSEQNEDTSHSVTRRNKKQVELKL